MTPKSIDISQYIKEPLTRRTGPHGTLKQVGVPSASERQEQIKPKHGFPPPEVREARLRQPVAASWPLHGPLLEDRRIENAIQEAKPGIGQYLVIMELVPRVNVTDDEEFQRKFNAFYRVMRRPPEWYKTYFTFMELGKQSKPTFAETLDHLWNAFGRCEASFSSKLVATLDPTQPIWDTFVLKNLQIKRPTYGSKDRVAEAKAAYERIRGWYEEFLTSPNGQRIISAFNRNVEEHTKLTDLKKVDFVLWKTRPSP